MNRRAPWHLLLAAIGLALSLAAPAEPLRLVFVGDIMLDDGPGKLIAFLTDGLVVRKILSHLGLPTEPPALAPARAPPERELAW